MHDDQRWGWRRSARMAVFVMSLALSQRCAAQEAAPAVRLTIDYGDGVQKTFVALPWKDKLTVFDALQAAERHPRGIRLAYTGKGDTTFVTAIDGQENEGADQRNWRYTVNDQPARYSAGVMELKNGDSVVWRFAK